MHFKSSVISYFLSKTKKSRIKILTDVVDQKDQHIISLYEKIEKLSSEKKNFHERVKELEDMKGEAFQVKLRNEIIELKIDFTKLEMVTFLAGTSLLLERTKNPDDAKIYIELIEKINGFIENMKE